MTDKLLHHVEPASEARWSSIARASEEATFFHSPIWHRVMERTFDGRRDRSLVAEFCNGTRAVLPMAELPANVPMVLRNFMSTHFSSYGGPVADGPIPRGGLDALLAEYPRASAYRIEVMGNPLGRDRPIQGFRPTEDFTHLLSLDRPWEVIFADFSRGHRSSYRKARKRGVKVRVGSSEDDWRDYYRAYEASLARWGDDVSNVHPRRLFDALRELSVGYRDAIRLWVAEVDGHLASAAIVFYWNRHVDYWHGAAHQEFFDYRPNNLLHGVIIEDAIERGFGFYDFNPSGGHEGVATFKERFGAKRVPFRRWRYKNPLAERFESVKDRLLERLR